MHSTPEINVIDYVENLTCTFCKKKVSFAIAKKDTSTCKDCHNEKYPEYASILNCLDDVLTELKEQAERKMSKEGMHELYGNK